MTYKEASDFLQGIAPKGIVLGLTTIKELMRRLGDPQNALKFIHIAGTNGKGSTGAFLSSVLQCAEYRVGHYSSPAVFSREECFQVNGESISQERFAEYIERIRGVCREMEEIGWNHPTVFEIETAVSFLYFKEEACDLVVLECGMGGREDATNIVKNVVCTVFTAISLDHMSFLGDTLEKIADQKAGIMKPDVPVVTDMQPPEVMAVLEEEAFHKNVHLWVAYTDRAKAMSMEELPEASRAAQMFEYKFHKNIMLSLPGTFQMFNASVAIEVCELLKDWGYSITEKQLKDGLMQAKLPGRMEIVSESPLVVIDGAHNPAGARQLKASLDDRYPDKKKVYILGVLADKDYEGVIRETLDGAEYVYTVTPDNKRALPAKDLCQCVLKQGGQAHASEDFASALAGAKEKAGKDGVIVAFGSFTFLKEIKALV